MEGATPFPGDSLVDFVTYADRAVRIRLESERTIDLTDEERRRGEGTTTRIVAAAVGEVVWVSDHEGMRKVDPHPDRIDIADGGSMIDEKGRRRLRVGGRPELQVGGEYLSIRVFSNLGFKSQEPQWVSMQYFRVVNDRLNLSGYKIDDGGLAAQNKSTVSEFVSALESTKVDPRAEEYLALDPAARYNEIMGDVKAGRAK